MRGLLSRVGEPHRVATPGVAKYLIGEVAERSKALDWNSSNISTGVRGFESHPLRQNLKSFICGPFLNSGGARVWTNTPGSTKAPGAILDDAQRRTRRACGQHGRSNPTLSARRFNFVVRTP